jgi:glycosyltransferase involved in cell wall biosynthesis
MRIAWLGPPPSDDPGVPTVATLLIEGLANAGVEIDVYSATGQTQVSPRLRSLPRVVVRSREQGWHWDRWYSRGDVSVLTQFSEQATRARAQHRLTDELRERHREIGYDLIYQFSQPELLSLRHHLTDLPPVVVHPQVHAEGELRWLRRERAFSRQLEPPLQRAGVRCLLTARSRIQRRDLKLATAVIAPSRSHAALLQADYGLNPQLVHVLPNPVDVDFYSPGVGPSAGQEPQQIAFVSRLSVRKGVEMVIDLSHRLADLRGRVRIEVVGFPSQWSDYRGLLDQLEPRIASFTGNLHGQELRARYRGADLCVVPSHYEPFGLTAAEALACGTPVVASDAVGAVEGIHAICCERFPAGDAAAFETTVRTVLARMPADRASARASARTEAVSRFDHVSIGSRLADLLDRVAGAGR